MSAGDVRRMYVNEALAQGFAAGVEGRRCYEDGSSGENLLRGLRAKWGDPKNGIRQCDASIVRSAYSAGHRAARANTFK